MVQPLDESLHAQVTAWLNSGLPVPEVERRLVESGMTQEDASHVVNAVFTKRVSDATAREQRQARVPLIGGMILCLLGIVLIVVGIIPFVWPESGLPAGVGVFAGGLAGVGGGVLLIVRSVSSHPTERH